MRGSRMVAGAAAAAEDILRAMQRSIHARFREMRVRRVGNGGHRNKSLAIVVIDLRTAGRLLN